MKLEKREKRTETNCNRRAKVLDIRHDEGEEAEHERKGGDGLSRAEPSGRTPQSARVAGSNGSCF